MYFLVGPDQEHWCKFICLFFFIKPCKFFKLMATFILGLVLYILQVLFSFFFFFFQSMLNFSLFKMLVWYVLVLYCNIEYILWLYIFIFFFFLFLDRSLKIWNNFLVSFSLIIFCANRIREFSLSNLNNC